MSNLTVAGVISTGTHGSGAAYGIMSSYVRVGTDGSDFFLPMCVLGLMVLIFARSHAEGFFVVVFFSFFFSVFYFLFKCFALNFIRTHIR